MLTEKEAWQFCADAFDEKNLSISSIGFCYSKAVPGSPCGICDVICFSEFDSALKMSEKIKAFRLANNKFSLYVWPLDLEGAKQRVQFCLNQIKLLEKELSK